MKHLFALALMLFSSLAVAAGDTTPPPSIERTTYVRWLKAIKSVVSPFDQKIFAWYEQQRNLPLPNEVNADPQKLFVSVERPLAATIELEDAGEIEKAVTYGLETYGIVDAPVEMALETIMFRWGKPVGQAQGTTYPTDPVYGFREEKLEPQWGEGAYRTITHKTGGGVAKEMHDVYSLLVRGDARSGYVLVGSFIGKEGRNQTQTTSFITIVMLKPTADGKTDYRVAGFHMGQNYGFLGIEHGRKNYGFNRDRIRGGQKEFYDQVAELKKTGKITEKRP